MTLFRPQKRTLAEAMGEVEEINSLNELIEKIKTDLSIFKHSFSISSNTVHVEFYCYDKRINWNTYIVTLDGYGVIGFTNGPLI